MNTKVTTCLGCDSPELEFLFSLGELPLPNALVEPGKQGTEWKAELDLMGCRRCLLVQLGTLVDPSRLFGHYLHTSAASEGNRRHLNSVAELVWRKLGLSPGASLLEVGSNDGTLLQALKSRGFQVLGVDPAANLAAEAKGRGIETVVAFFGADTAQDFLAQGKTFDAIVALNVVAHTPHFISLLTGVRTLLKPGGKFLMENAYVVDTILKGQFDTIYHEHFHNFSFHALCSAYERVGLVPLEVELIPTQGCSIRVIAGRREDGHAVSPSVSTLLAKERSQKLNELSTFQGVGEKLATFKKDLRLWVRDQKKAGKKIVAVGASARGMVIANYCELGGDDLAYVLDDTTLKHGRLTPGGNFEVSPWSRLKSEPTDTFLLLSWNYAESLIPRLKALAPHGKALVPFPTLSEVTW